MTQFGHTVIMDSRKSSKTTMQFLFILFSAYMVRCITCVAFCNSLLEPKVCLHEKYAWSLACIVVIWYDTPT